MKCSRRDVLGEIRGDENWHLHRADIGRLGSESIDLTPYPHVRVMSLELSTALPDRAFVQMDFRSPELIDLFEIDIGALLGPGISAIVR